MFTPLGEAAKLSALPLDSRKEGRWNSSSDLGLGAPAHSKNVDANLGNIITYVNVISLNPAGAFAPR
jgi:hypothetical protein